MHSASRSPTPASDMIHPERQRVAFSPTIYQGMPYVFHCKFIFMLSLSQL